YPTFEVVVDREKAATSGLTVHGVATGLIPATSSSRFGSPSYWQDPKNGQSYLVQVQVPPPRTASAAALGQIPVRSPANGHGPAAWAVNGDGHVFMSETGGGASAGAVLLRDVATIRETVSPETVDRFNMRRMLSITANVGTTDLGKVGRAVRRAIADEGLPPKGVSVDVRGQVEALDTVMENLAVGLGVAVLAIFLLLT